MNVHCSTCGQDLPEPQRRLAEAAIAMARLDRKQTRSEIAMWSDCHGVDEVWELRSHEEPFRNRKRMAEFKCRAKLFGLTVPMKRHEAEFEVHCPPGSAMDLIEPVNLDEVATSAPLSRGELGTFHHLGVTT